MELNPFVLVLTKDPMALMHIIKLSKPSCKLAGRNSYYCGRDRETGCKRYIVERKRCDELKKLIDCEIWEI